MNTSAIARAMNMGLKTREQGINMGTQLGNNYFAGQENKRDNELQPHRVAKAKTEADAAALDLEESQATSKLRVEVQNLNNQYQAAVTRAFNNPNDIEAKREAALLKDKLSAATSTLGIGDAEVYNENAGNRKKRDRALVTGDELDIERNEVDKRTYARQRNQDITLKDQAATLNTQRIQDNQNALDSYDAVKRVFSASYNARVGGFDVDAMVARGELTPEQAGLWKAPQSAVAQTVGLARQQVARASGDDQIRMQGELEDLIKTQVAMTSGSVMAIHDKVVADGKIDAGERAELSRAIDRYNAVMPEGERIVGEVGEDGNLQIALMQFDPADPAGTGSVAWHDSVPVTELAGKLDGFEAELFGRMFQGGQARQYAENAAAKSGAVSTSLKQEELASKINKNNAAARSGGGKSGKRITAADAVKAYNENNLDGGYIPDAELNDTTIQVGMLMDAYPDQDPSVITAMVRAARSEGMQYQVIDGQLYKMPLDERQGIPTR